RSPGRWRSWGPRPPRPQRGTTAAGPRAPHAPRAGLRTASPFYPYALLPSLFPDSGDQGLACWHWPDCTSWAGGEHSAASPSRAILGLAVAGVLGRGFGRERHHILFTQLRVIRTGGQMVNLALPIALDGAFRRTASSVD